MVANQREEKAKAMIIEKNAEISPPVQKLARWPYALTCSLSAGLSMASFHTYNRLGLLAWNTSLVFAVVAIVAGVCGTWPEIIGEVYSRFARSAKNLKIGSSNHSASIQTDDRNNRFDALRLILALGVILTHSYSFVYGEKVYNPIAWMGGLGVDAFFLASGYMISQSWERSPRVVSFLTKRVLRIYPAFIAACFVGIIVSIFPCVQSNPTAYLRKLFDLLPAYSIKMLALQVGALPVLDTINGSAWTIPFEFACYIGVMFLGVMRISTNRKAMLFLFVITYIGFIGQSIFAPSTAITPNSAGQWPRLATYYLAGMLLNHYKQTVPLDYRLAIASMIIVIGSIIVFGSAGLVSVIPIAYLVFWFAFTREIPKVRLKADISYGMYIYAWPIQLLLIHALHHSAMPIFVLAVLATVVPISLLSWYFIERPALSLKQRRHCRT